MERNLQSVLAEWRDVDRRMAETDPSADEYEVLTERAAWLRDEYQRVSAGAVATADQLGAASRETWALLESSARAAAESREALRRVKGPHALADAEADAP